MSDKTLGKLKKRVLETLGEYIADSDGVVICDGDRELLLSRIPDAVSACLHRMYESLDVGRKRSTGLIYRKSCIYYHPAKIKGDEGVEFECGGYIGIYFKYFGSGEVSLYSEGGSVLESIVCEGDGTAREMKYAVNVTEPGKIRVVTVGSITVNGFTVYADADTFPTDALCENNEDSFALPSDFESLISAECEFGEVDAKLVRTEKNIGFAPGFLLRGADFVAIEYKKCPELVTDGSPDTLGFEMPSLAFDALVYLTCAELCREGEADIYTRLVYKYNDISQALMRRYEKGRRNGFYRQRRLKRW